VASERAWFSAAADVIQYLPRAVIRRYFGARVGVVISRNNSYSEPW